MSIVPNQNVGIETPTNAKVVLVTSTHEFCFLAEIIPAMMPIKTATTILATANLTVVGNRVIIASVTACSFGDRITEIPLQDST